MARPIRDELRYAAGELKRFVRSQWKEYMRLYYQNMAAFAKSIARGTISLVPTPEDVGLDRVGKFWAMHCNLVEKEVAFRYGTIGWTSGFLNMSIHQYNRKRDQILLKLDGYLKAFAET